MSFSKVLLGLLLLFPIVGSARDGPTNNACTANVTPFACCTGLKTGTCHTNIVNVTGATAGNSGNTYACIAADNPYDCCTGANAGSCDNIFIGLNGADICVGLEQCSAMGGCRLQLPDATIEEGEFRIYGTRYWSPAVAADKPCGGNYPNGFPNGLIIQGKGIGNTILVATADNDPNDKARRENNTAAGSSSSVIAAALAGGLTASELPFLIFQDFTIDGLRELQPSSVVSQFGYYGHGELGDEPAIPRLVLRRLRVEDTTRHLVDIGNYETNTAGNTIMGQTWILDSDFFGGGCLQAHNEGTGQATGIAPCGCSRSDASTNCAGWAWEVAGVGFKTPICPGPTDANVGCTGVGTPYPCCTGAGAGPHPQCAWDLSVCPGWVNQGSNLVINTPSNTLVAHSKFDSGAHFDIAAGSLVPNSCTNAYEDPPVSPDKFWTQYCGTGWTVKGNRFTRVGGSGIDNHGTWRTYLVDNTFDGTCLDDNWGVSECGNMTFASSPVIDLRIVGNYFASHSRRGLELNMWRPSPSERDPHAVWPTHVVENNTFELDCRRCPPASNPQFCEPLTVESGAGGQWGEFTSVYAFDDHDILLKNNTFQNTDGINNCVASLIVNPYQSETTFTGGRHSTVGLTIDGGNLIAGGQNGMSDGWGFTGDSTVNRAIAYFNYVSGLKIKNVTFTGTGSDGKVTFGRGTSQDNMGSSCYQASGAGQITLQSGATVVNRYPIATTCP